MHPVRTLLADLLHARDRAAADAARVALGQPTAEDQATIHAIVLAWKETDAIANIFFYPELLPLGGRAQWLIRGLKQEEHPYIKLAAAVGARHLRKADLDRTERATLRDLLLRAIADHPHVIAAQASVALPQCLDEQDNPSLIVLLNSSDALVQHNALVALVRVNGHLRAREILDDAAQSGAVSLDAQSHAQHCFAELQALLDSGLPPTHAVLLSSLGAATLAPIPEPTDQR